MLSLRKITAKESVRKISRAVFAAGLLLASGAEGVVWAAPPSIEYQIKASLIYNFLHFVEWPKDAERQNNQYLEICLVGEDVYGEALRVLDGEVVNGRRLIVRNQKTETNVKNLVACRVVIFSSHSRGRAAELLPLLTELGVMAIGDAPGFLEAGGIIEFLIINDKVQFEINLSMATQNGLQVSSKLLRLAHRVLQE